MQKVIICTECANRCHLLVEQVGEEIVVKGNRCPRGLKSGKEEFLGERVTVKGFVRNASGEKLPVQTNKPVAKGMVYKVTLAIKRVKIDGEAAAGAVLVENIASSGADLIVSGEE